MKTKKLNSSEKVSRARQNMPQEDAWYRLDNSGVLYPMLSKLNFQSLFRVGATLTEAIDPLLLHSALVAALDRYPGFRVQLRQGAFRYFFDYNPDLPVINTDSGALFRKIDFRKNNRYLFRVTYFENRISIDFWHCLTDGAGAAEFLKTLVYTYLNLRYGTLPQDGSVRLSTDPPKEDENEDAFLKYYKPFKLFDGIDKMTEGSVLGLSGKHFLRQGYGLIEGRVASDSLHALARKNNATVTELLLAILMLSVSEVYQMDIQKHKNKDLVAMVPINLRKLFASNTLRNFVMMAKPRLNPTTTPATLSAYLEVLKPEMARQKTKEELSDKIAFTSLMDKLVPCKILPQFVKTFFVKFGKLFSTAPQQTFILSNLGKIALPAGLETYLHDFYFYLNCNKKSPENVAVCSYNNCTVIAFTRFLKSTELDRVFFKTLADLGLTVEVASNFRELYGREHHVLPKM